MNQLLNARLGKKYLFSCSVLLLSWQLTGCSDDTTPDTTADTTGPVITLNGNANIEVVFNAFFDDIGAQAVDDIDGEVPVTLEGTVDTSIPGTYELTYMAADSSGNTSELVRTVEVLSDPLLEASVSMPAPPIAFFFDGTLIGADYWSQEPQILSGGVGFSDILGVEADEVTEGLAREVGGTWSSDISCGTGTGNYTTVATQDQISRGYIQQAPYGELKDGALGIDGLPIVFSWPVDTRTISLTDFQFTLNTGDIVRPLAASPIPNHEDNERNVIVVFGEFANRLPSDDPNARYPIKLRIVQDDTPLLLVGPNNQLVSAAGMTWETSTSPYDENNGPRLVGAKLNRLEGPMRGESVSGIPNPLIRQLAVPANDASVLYDEGDFMLRMLTTGGFSPDGVSGVKPIDFERFFRIHVMGVEGNNVIVDKVNQDFNVKGGTLRVVGLSDLGQPEGDSVAFDECYAEDRDNYIDIILVGDEEAARSITHLEIPSLDGGYSAFYNPGGPGRTPFEGVVYTSPGPADLEPVIIALDDPMRIDYTPTVDTSQEDGDQDIGANESIPRCASYYDDEMTAQAPNAAKWCREGAVMRWQSADWPSPTELFYHCEGEPSDPAIYLQHGWPTSSFDFQELSAALSSDHYVCSLDTPGYGFSDKPDGYPYSILEDGEIVQVFIEDIMAVDELLLLTHDKGDSVGLELLHRYNSGLTSFEINRFILLNGSIHLAEANISDSQTRLLSADTGPQIALGLDASILAAGLGLSTFSPPLTAAGIGELASVLDFDEGTRVLHQTIQYLEERRVYEDTRWLRALADSVVPTTLIWGELDPVAVPAVADYVWDEVLSTRLAPAEYFRVPCANHYIQNDRAQDVLAIVRGGALPAHQDSQCERTHLFRSTLGDTQ